jgi:hypothetical protein
MSTGQTNKSRLSRHIPKARREHANAAVDGNTDLTSALAMPMGRENEGGDVRLLVMGSHARTVTGRESLTVLPHEDGKRSAMDISFRTLAETHTSRSTAIVLSVVDGDGTLGIKRVQKLGPPKIRLLLHWPESLVRRLESALINIEIGSLLPSLVWKISENYQMNRVVQIHSLLSKIRAIVSESLAGKERF